MSRTRIPAIGLATAIVVATALACAGPDRATRPEFGGTPALLVGRTSGLLECPGSVPRYASGVVTPEAGGTVMVGGFSIALPAGAVAEPQTLSITVPESPFLEVDIRVEGVEHFQFLQPAVVTLDYSRCGISTAQLGELTAWYLDPATKTPLENMGGVDDRLSRKLTFVTPHLSGYGIITRTDGDSTGTVGSYTEETTVTPP
jgi:hypothetical protein